jgi:hypothetical protein
MPQPPKPGEKGVSSWKAIIRWAIMWRGLEKITDVAAPLANGSQPAGAKHKRLGNKRIVHVDPLCFLDTVHQLNRKLRTQEAWATLSGNARFLVLHLSRIKVQRELRTQEAWSTLGGNLRFLVLHLSRIKVRREYGMALLYKKASGRFIPQFLLPTIWKSCIADWDGRDDEGVRCLLCVMNGKKNRHPYVYRNTLIKHICRDHFFIGQKQLQQLRSTKAQEEQLRQLRSTKAPGITEEQLRQHGSTSAQSARFSSYIFKRQNRRKKCPATDVNFQRKVCRHCAFRGCAKCGEDFDASPAYARFLVTGTLRNRVILQRTPSPAEA